MKLIPIDMAQAGMVLAQPVLSASGAALMPIGAPLTDPVIARLRQMGVPSVAVRPESQTGTTVRPPKEEVVLRHRFRKVSDDPLQQALFAACLQHLRTKKGSS